MEIKMDEKKRYVVPVFPMLPIREIPPMSALLFYGENNLTKWHGRNRRPEFGRVDLVPTHSALVYQNHTLGSKPSPDNFWILDPEVTTTISLLTEYSKKLGLRIDVITYPMNTNQRAMAYEAATALLREENFYDGKGYLGALSEMPGCAWMEPFLPKPSEKNMFCSDAVAWCIQTNGGMRISKKEDHNKTYPVDELVYAIESTQCNIYTIKKAGCELPLDIDTAKW